MARLGIANRVFNVVVVQRAAGLSANTSRMACAVSIARGKPEVTVITKTPS
jgi:hypothetical protein